MRQAFQFLRAAWTKLRAANFELLVRNRRTRPMFPTIARNCGRQLNHVSAMFVAEEIAEFFHSGVVKAVIVARGKIMAYAVSCPGLRLLGRQLE